MKFIGKHLQERKPQKSFVRIATPKEVFGVISNEKTNEEVTEEVKKPVKKKKNKIEKNKSTMDTSEKIAMAKEILGKNANENFKILKSDKGLIERTESSKTILTEDNKELLID